MLNSRSTSRASLVFVNHCPYRVRTESPLSVLMLSVLMLHITKSWSMGLVVLLLRPLGRGPLQVFKKKN